MNRLGSIGLGILLAIFVAASFVGSYFQSTKHSDSHTDHSLCLQHKKTYQTIDKLILAAQTLVATDPNIDARQRAHFVLTFSNSHSQIQKDLRNLNC